MSYKIYSTDSYASECEATVIDVDFDDRRVLLDQTVFYPGGGGQPHDLGQLIVSGDSVEVRRVTQDREGVWHWTDSSPPSVGTPVVARIDWERRFLLMRTHTAIHALCGVMWDRFHAPVTGGNMTAGEGRLDFELPQWHADDRNPIEIELNRQLELNHQVNVSFLPRVEADADPSLIRTKVSLLPASLDTVRVIDIIGLDRQADGGTHVNSTREVGRISITKTESKGRGFRRIRLKLEDAP